MTAGASAHAQKEQKELQGLRTAGRVHTGCVTHEPGSANMNLDVESHPAGQTRHTEIFFVFHGTKITRSSPNKILFLLLTHTRMSFEGK